MPELAGTRRGHVGLDDPDAESVHAGHGGTVGRWAATCGLRQHGAEASTFAPARLILAKNPVASEGPVQQDQHARLQLLRCWVAWPLFRDSWSATSSVGVSEPRPAACRTACRYRASRPIAVTEVEMATRTTITLEDDINGGPAEETLQFRLGTAEYEIDLNAKNARRFRAQMAPFIDHARKAGRRQRRGHVPPPRVSTAPTSGPGRKRTTSRSATAGASRPVSSNSTKHARPSADRYRYRLDHEM